jgi:hypothetical protein
VNEGLGENGRESEEEKRGVAHGDVDRIGAAMSWRGGLNGRREPA